jgi:hypothetical protein
MAIFKIIASRRGTKPDSAEFEIQPVSGEVLVGDEFRCYDTHHPIEYRVQAIKNAPEKITLLCDGFFSFDEQFVGAIIDTTKKGRPRGFHYKRPKRFGGVALAKGAEIVCHWLCQCVGQVDVPWCYG